MAIYNRFSELDQAPNILGSLGVDEEVFINAGVESYRLAMQSIATDAPDFRGHSARTGVIRSLRGQLMCLGWSMQNLENFPWTYSPCSRVRIGVSVAERIGVASHVPQLPQRGPVFHRAVRANPQLSLLGDNVPDAIGFDTDSCETWMLLFQHVEDSESSRTILELSRPVYQTASRGRRPVLLWEDRIFFEPIVHNELPSNLVGDDEVAGEDIDFDVSSRE